MKTLGLALAVLLSSLSLASASEYCPPAAPASALTVGEGFVEPLGYYDRQPTFSWKLPEGVEKQRAYRLQVDAGSSHWDSGWVESEQSTFVPYQGVPLLSRQQVAWRVNFRDERGAESGWSEMARFELGLLSANDWTAKWVRPSGERDPAREQVGLLRRSISLTKPVARARLYATARGLFELRLNGERVGRDYFANGFTSYDKRLDTLTYDVTKQLHGGENTLEGALGTGWYAGRYPFETQKKGPYGANPALLVQLEIVYADGSSETFASDGTWEGSFDGPIRSSSLYDGEEYDARLRPATWAPVCVETEGGDALLSPKPFAPVREVATLRAREITQPQPGRYVFDLGQNMVGWARIKVPVEKDRTVILRFAEMLKDDGTLYTESYRSAKSTDSYTAAQDGIVEWEPHFTFHGFRYVELSGLPEGVTPQKDWVTGVVLHSDMTKAGDFVSSHAKLNRLQSNIVWGWRGNSLDIPTDCPQRDERAGWTGDAQVFCATALLNTGSHAFWKSWLRSLRDDQEPDGTIPDFVPHAHKNFGLRSPGWMDAAVFIPWEIYVRTGDLGVLKENYAMMEKLVAWYRSQSVDGLLPKIKGYGDWLQPYPRDPQASASWMGDRVGDTSLPLLGAAFYARDLRLLSSAARLLGREADARRYEEEADRVARAFHEHFFGPDGKVRNAPETQTSYVLALAFDLLPPDARSLAGEHLARLVAEADGHLRTGFLGTPYLVKVLDDTGHPDLAYSLLFKETYPSWFYSINQGATTLWERWNSYTRDKGFGDVSMNSFNHYAYGAIGQWLYERVAGLSPDPAYPGYKHFFVRPLVGRQLDSARAELETPYGRALSSWVRKSGKVELEVVVPPNTTATVELPGSAPTVVRPGTHRFEIKDE